MLPKLFSPKQINICLVWLFRKRFGKSIIEQLAPIVPLILIHIFLYLCYRVNRKRKKNPCVSKCLMMLCVRILMEFLYDSCFLFWCKMVQSQNLRLLHCKIFVTQKKQQKKLLVLHSYSDTCNLPLYNEVNISLCEFHMAFELVHPLNGNQLSVVIGSIVCLIK